MVHFSGKAGRAPGHRLPLWRVATPHPLYNPLLPGRVGRQHTAPLARRGCFTRAARPFNLHAARQRARNRKVAEDRTATAADPCCSACTCTRAPHKSWRRVTAPGTCAACAEVVVMAGECQRAAPGGSLWPTNPRYGTPSACLRGITARSNGLPNKTKDHASFRTKRRDGNPTKRASSTGPQGRGVRAQGRRARRENAAHLEKEKSAMHTRPCVSGRARGCVCRRGHGRGCGRGRVCACVCACECSR